jgi:5-methylcytosine-specific restriction protein A
MKPCLHPGCNKLTRETRCEEHKQLVQRLADKKRETASERGYNSKWQKARKTFLQKNPLCAECDKSNRVTAATVVDHIKPHKGDQKLFWNKSNWQPLCKRCHDRKTAREDGGFGKNINK